MEDSDSSSDLFANTEGDNRDYGEEPQVMNIGGVQAYMYEPVGRHPAAGEEGEAAAAVLVPEMAPNQQRLNMQATEWCRCGNCATMDTEDECKCCQEIIKVEEKCREAEPVPNCMIEHPGFHSIALCPWNLQAVYFGYRQLYGRMQRAGIN